MPRPLGLLLVAVLAIACLFAGNRRASADDLPLVVKEDFENGAERWRPMDPNSWKVLSTPRGQVYSLFAQSKYKPPHRSPVNIALLKDAVVSDFVLELKLQSTVKDYDHRSLVVVFGYQDPAHFYYVHFGKKTDDHANQIFIVNDSPRKKISTQTTPGTPWDDAWHTVKIVRTVKDGQTAVFFDDLDHPVMKAADTTFAWGGVGIGAFDDLGNFDDITLRGTTTESRGTNQHTQPSKEHTTMSAEARLAELKLELPPAPKAAGVYKPVVVVGNMAYVSGHGPLLADKSMLTGRVGAEVDLAGGVASARQTGLAILSTLRENLGSLDAVVRVVKTLGMVNATPDFTQHPQVINGCSELFRDIWGDDKGVGARSAVGMGSLPGNISTEIEVIFEIDPAKLKK